MDIMTELHEAGETIRRLRAERDAAIAEVGRLRADSTERKAELVKLTTERKALQSEINRIWSLVGERDAEIERLRETVTPALDVLSELLKYSGGCDHDVGICCCREYGILESARAALAAKGE